MSGEKLKLDGNLTSSGNNALADLAGRLYANLGMKVIGVAELSAIKRTQVAPDEKDDPTVTLRLTSIEIARGDNEQRLRDAMNHLHIARTAHGTLTEDHDIAFSERMLERLGGDLMVTEAARMRAGVMEAHHYLMQTADAHDLTMEQIRNEVRTVAKALFKLGFNE